MIPSALALLYIEGTFVTDEVTQSQPLTDEVTQSKPSYGVLPVVASSLLAPFSTRKSPSASKPYCTAKCSAVLRLLFAAFTSAL